MKVRSAVLLAAMSLVAAAQRGAMPAGHMPGGPPSGGRRQDGVGFPTGGDRVYPAGALLALAQSSHTLRSARTMVWPVPVRLSRRSVLLYANGLQPRLLSPGAVGKPDERHGDARPTTAATAATIAAAPADGQRANRGPRAPQSATGNSATERQHEASVARACRPLRRRFQRPLSRRSIRL